MARKMGQTQNKGQKSRAKSFETNALTEKIREELKKKGEKSYAEFQAVLLPTVPADTILGVRTPLLRAYAKELKHSEEKEIFLSELPHQYFDENQLHAFLVSQEKDYEICIEKTEQFLPYIDNWATCDQFSPKVFKTHKKDLLPYIKEWIFSTRTYTIRFGAGMLMRYFLDTDFLPEYHEWMISISSKEYYVNMMIAWYFATALAKQYEATIPILAEHRLSDWIHQKTIQKAVESRRISKEKKEELRTLREKQK